MKKVFKYELRGPVDTVEMPSGADVVHVGLKGDKVCLWAVVDPDAPVVRRRFEGFTTGMTIENPGALTHLATLVHEDGHVDHIFERAN